MTDYEPTEAERAKFHSIQTAHYCSAIDAYGDEGAGYDYRIFAENLEDAGWVYKGKPPVVAGDPEGEQEPLIGETARIIAEFGVPWPQDEKVFVGISCRLEDKDFWRPTVTYRKANGAVGSCSYFAKFSLEDAQQSLSALRQTEPDPAWVETVWEIAKYTPAYIMTIETGET